MFRAVKLEVPKLATSCLLPSRLGKLAIVSHSAACLKNGFCRTAILEHLLLAALYAIAALIYKHILACQAVGEALKRHRCGNRQRQTLCCRQAVAA